MERLNNIGLNNIIGRTTPARRPANSEMRASSPGIPAQRVRPPVPQPTQPISRRPASEQVARPEPRMLYNTTQHYSPTMKVRNIQNPSAQEGRAYGAPYTRPLYRQRPAPARITGDYSPQPHEEVAYPQAFHQHPANEYHHTGEYPPPSDVAEEWEDDTSGMRYGDWEGENDEVVVYQRADTRIIADASLLYASNMHDISNLSDRAMQSRVTRNLGNVRLPITTIQQPTAPQAHLSEEPQHGRITQPLNQQTIINVSRTSLERESAAETPYLHRQMHQVIPREPAQIQPYPSTKPVATQKSVCPTCKGFGYLRANVPFGHPNFGKPIACECKEAERKEKRRQQLLSMSDLDAYRDNSFQTFNSRVPGVQEAYAECVDYAENPEGWLLMIGPNGCGKTHLATAIAKLCLDRGSVVLFSVVPDLLDHLRATFAPKSEEVYDHLFSKMREAEVLVLDDLGAQQSSPWANEKLFQLLNYRYNMDMPTVITANPKGLQGTDERIYSRLSDVSLVRCINMDRARDYRPNHPRRG